MTTKKNAHFAGQQRPVDEAGQAAVDGELPGPEAGNGDQLHRRPVADQKPDEPHDLPAQLRLQHNQPGEHVGEPDTTQHAGEAGLREAHPKQAVVVDDAEYHQDQAAPHDVDAQIASPQPVSSASA